MANALLHVVFHMFRIYYNIFTWPTRKLTAYTISIADYLFSKTKPTIQKLLFLWSIIITLALVSILLYATFYTAYVPAAEISRPVHFTFSVCSTGAGICSFPSADVSFWNEDGKFQEFPASGQTYSLRLELVVPDSHRNRDIGMFMVVLKLYDKDRNVTGRSQRSLSMSESAVFQSGSIIMRVLDAVFLKPMSILGLLEQKRALTVELFPNFVDDYYHPSVGAVVEVHSHIIEIYSATLRLSAKFTGLKYFLYNWPLVSAVCAFWFNLCVLALGLAIVLYLRGEKAQTINGNKGRAVSSQQTMNSHDSRKLSSYSTRTKICEDSNMNADTDTNDFYLVADSADCNRSEQQQPFSDMNHRRKK
ncbi:hypothetical protein BsWGS_10193 [Bradybaena similaris]